MTGVAVEGHAYPAEASDVTLVLSVVSSIFPCLSLSPLVSFGLVVVLTL